MSTQQKFTLKEDSLFMLVNERGDIYPSEVSPEQGLYRDDTRFLSHLELKIEGYLPRLLSSTIKRDNILFTADLTNPPIPEKSLPRDTIHILREKFLYHNVCYERITLRNYEYKDVALRLSLRFGADFIDIFELRGVKRTNRGVTLSPRIKDNEILFLYRGVDERERITTVRFNPPPAEINNTTAIYHILLPPGQKREIVISVEANYQVEATETFFVKTLHSAVKKVEEMKNETVSITTTNEHFNDLIDRCLSDICTLVTLTPYGPYPYAGIPWYSTVFGRDGLITALQCLWISPKVARGVLRFLAATQAKEVYPDNDAEPGKIIHEMRWGEMASTGEVPFRQYYGSVDATPLFIALAGEYLKRTGDIETIQEIWPNIVNALRWINEYGDRDGDGFIEYHRRSEKGLVNQAWKDSYDSVFYKDGTLVRPPVAIVEVQSYVYWAYQSLIKMVKLLGLSNTSELLKDINNRVKILKKNFQKFFWSKDLGMYYLALDKDKKPCAVRTSNAGHTLVSGLATKTSARLIAKAFMQDDFFSGWGIRTLPKTEIKYNPMSYHNGSVWPHDNAIIALGLSRYGFKRQTLRIMDGLFEASQYIELKRLPELFCGFDRRHGEGPTLYPVACQPQAWASGSVFMLIQAILGLTFESETNSIIFKNPVLPEFIDAMELKNLKFMDSTVSLRLERFKSDVVINVLDKEGDVNIVIYK